MKMQALCVALAAALTLSACAVAPEASTQGNAAAAAAPADKGIVVTGSKIPRRDIGAESVSAAGREEFERSRDGANQAQSFQPAVGGR